MFYKLGDNMKKDFKLWKKDQQFNLFPFNNFGICAKP